MYIVYKTATTGLWDKTKQLGDKSQPRMCALAWALFHEDGNLVDDVKCRVCKLPDTVEIPETASRIHGYTREVIRELGKPINWALGEFLMDWYKAWCEVVYNSPFDLNIVSNELILAGREPLGVLREGREGGMQYYDLMQDAKPFCNLTNKWGKPQAPKMFLAYELLTKNKWGANPSLEEQVLKLGELFEALKVKYAERDKNTVSECTV